MADLIEIGVEVRTNSVRSATKEVDSLGKTLKSAERSASAFVDAFARQERQVSKAAIANKAYSSTAQKMYNEILKIDTATKSASASASVFAANLDKEARAAAQVAKENDRLKSKFVEGYTAMNIYTKELNELAIARKRDIITSEQQKAAVAQLNAQMKAGTGVFANAATGMQIVGKRANRSGVLMQQAGYQFGDFAVQVQSGTNVMVAFGQQATQLIGTFSMLAKSTRMIALFSGLGVVVPILTAIGAALMRTGENAKNAAKEVDEYANALERLQGELKGLERARLAATTSFDPDALVASQKRLELANRIAETELDLLTLKGRNRKGLAETLASLKEQLATENARFSSFMKRLKTEREADEKRKAAAEWEEGAADRIANRLSQRNDFMEYYNKLQDDLKSKQEADAEWEEGAADRIANRLSQRNDFMEYYNKLQDDLKSKQKAAAAADAKAATAAQKLLELQIKISATPAYEPMSALAVEAANSQAEMIKIFETTVALKEELGESAFEALRLGGVDLSNVDAASKSAALLAARLGYSYEEALKLQKISADPLNAFGGAGPFIPNYVEDDDKKKKELKSINDVIAALREQTDQETKLLGLTGERRTEEEIFYQLVQENAKADIKVSKDKLRAIAKEIAAQKKANASFEKLIDITGELSDAFGDYVANGLKDFSSFTDTIKSMFKKLLSDMVSMAIRNKILIPIATGTAAGFGSAAAGASMGQYATGGAQAGTIGATLATGASNFGSAALHTMTGGTYGSVAAGSTMASIGAAVPYILAAVAVIGLFTKKTKLLDSGIRTTIEGFDVAIETFKKTQTSRLFGLLKGSKKTAYEAASAEVADPLIEAIGNMQQSIVDAAGTLGIGANAFDDFSYQFKLSLKGLTEEEQLQKINEEITKMGDSFASLTGHFETMNELLEAANQRMQLQNRLDQLLGNNQAILTRQREAELKAMHELNRPLAQAIYDLEDAQAAVAQANQVVANSFAALRASIDAEKERIQDSFVSVLDGLKERLDVVNEALDQSRNIYDMLSNALSSRQVSGEAAFAGRRSSALSFLRGGDFSDERRLENALDVIAEPSEGLFSSFIDYARDFGRTSIIIDEAKKVAQVQLTAGEKQVLLLEEQIVASEANRDAQLDALDQQYQMMVDQYNALLGIDTSVKSVGEAIGTLRSAIESLASAQAASLAAANAAKAAAAVGSGGSSAGVQSASAAGAKVLEKLGQSGIATRASDGAQFKRINIRGSDQLLEVAKSLGIQTSGQTGAQLSQAISNAGNLGVNVDNATRAKQFAMGGYHTGGLRMVGERGPELEATGPSRIFSHNQTSGMFRDPDLKEAVNELRREVSGLRGEQRQMQATNAKYVKRNYDINRKWDVDGLPATRT